MFWQRIVKFLMIVLGYGLCSIAHAGPPFITDDPYLTDYQQGQAYFFAWLDKTNPGTTLMAPALEVDWGVTPSTEFHFILPLTTYFFPDGRTPTGSGDLELGMKLALIKETNDMPQITFDPLIYAPIGNAELRLGNGAYWMYLPLTIGKTWGPWVAYVNGGFILNTAPELQNPAYGGIVVQRNLGKKWTLGAEVYSQGQSDHELIKQFTALNLGGTYNVTDKFSLVFSAGHSIQGQANTLGYFGLYYGW